MLKKESAVMDLDADGVKLDRFLLVLLASRRVREIENGALLTRPREKHRDIVLALKEIKAGSVDVKMLYEGLQSEFVMDSPRFSVKEDVLKDADAPGRDETFVATLEAGEEPSQDT